MKYNFNVETITDTAIFHLLKLFEAGEIALNPSKTNGYLKGTPVQSNHRGGTPGTKQAVKALLNGMSAPAYALNELSVTGPDAYTQVDMTKHLMKLGLNANTAANATYVLKARGDVKINSRGFLQVIRKD